ncbi:hypothetical protein PRIPAC_75982 [Pristionchus pacificus]|uniref:Uncharacterized protein n=1 Tax=Pristionchus pacificus TaxID=54126 RepID=A0A2A6CFW7_PRIPA|nr:hypothetical protein PRIPAC_75982 [Pristionchus pacificus]|eukprot:PDM76911.1 hypothetical protein PRIPAC_42306 [Pristionchus pacificus]
MGRGSSIGWAFKTANMKRLGVDPAAGVLDRRIGGTVTNNDRVTIEWINTPDGAAKQFRREWRQGDDMVRRKNLPIEHFFE